jgi:hypothetical protein
MALAGPPIRANGPGIIGPTRIYDGYIKVRLGHNRWGSVIVPDQLVIKNAGWQFFQPSFFGPCVLGFDLEPGDHEARFSMDVGGPRESNPRRIFVTIRSNDLVREYADGSQVYACVIEGPEKLSPFASGKCEQLGEGEFALRLYHHTTPTNYPNIVASKELWSSPWNLAGVRKLENVAYAYLTSLPKIASEADLHRVAMASKGELRFQTTSIRSVEETLSLTVYRDDTNGRTASLEFQVPWALIAPPHLLLHQPATEQAYYEVVGPEIFRIGMPPSCKLTIAGKMLVSEEADRKSFDYVILGEANELDGLTAPYDEENTTMIMHCQRFASGQTLFDFWQTQQNSDQMTGRTFEAIRVQSR